MGSKNFRDRTNTGRLKVSTTRGAPFLLLLFGEGKGGRQLLKTTLRKPTLFSLKAKKNRLLATRIVLPAKIKFPIVARTANTIQTVHTTMGGGGSTTMRSKIARSSSRRSSKSSNSNSSSSRRSTSTTDKAVATNIATTKTTPKKPRKLSIKKFFSSSHKYNTRSKSAAPMSPAVSTVDSSVASPKMASETPPRVIPSVPLSPPNETNGNEKDIIIAHNDTKHDETNSDADRSGSSRSSIPPAAAAVALRRTNSGDTADLTVHTNTPPRDPKDNDDDCDCGDGFRLPATPSTASSSASSDNIRNPYIFSDDDESSDKHGATTTATTATTAGDAEPVPDAQSSSDGNAESDAIEARLDEEMRRFDERIRDQKADERAIAKEHLATTSSESGELRESTPPHGSNAPDETKHDPRDETTPTEETTATRTTAAATAATAAAHVSSSPKQGVKPKRRHRHKSRLDRKKARRQIRFCNLLSLLIPVVLLIPLLLLPEMPHHHDSLVDRANVFFLVETEDMKETPMKGITVVVSETTSSLGRQLEATFGRLGATVASLEFDCADLGSVSEAADTLLESHERIDFLVHTGNACIVPQKGEQAATIHETLHFVASTKTVQGYDALYAGNYLSSVLVTQKLLPKLERSPFGTLVQFSSPYSTLVDGSLLETSGDDPSEPPPAGRLLQQPQQTERFRFVSTLARLPVQFAYAKLSEVLQHRLIARAYPNIRTM
eukprot:jgi/Psemu1/16368/gm1.16368_g